MRAQRERGEREGPGPGSITVDQFSHLLAQGRRVVGCPLQLRLHVAHASPQRARVVLDQPVRALQLVAAALQVAVFLPQRGQCRGVRAHLCSDGMGVRGA